MDTGMIVALAGLGIAGLAAVLGIWMERDKSRPTRWAVSLSALIIMATVVSILQSVADAASSKKLEDDMARMLQQLEKIAATSPEAKKMLEAELSAQARSNPDVVKKLVARVDAEGGDSAAMLAANLPASEVKQISAKISSKTAADAQRKSASMEMVKLKAKLAEETKKAEKESAEKKKAEADLADEQEASEEKRAALLDIAAQMKSGKIDKKLQSKLLGMAKAGKKRGRRGGLRRKKAAPDAAAAGAEKKDDAAAKEGDAKEAAKPAEADAKKAAPVRKPSALKRRRPSIKPKPTK